MQSTLIAGAPNISGNVGSCTTQTVQVFDYQTFKRNSGTNYTTNSCTGQVVVTPFTNAAPGPIIWGTLGVCVGITLFIVALTKVHSWVDAVTYARRYNR